MGVFSGISVLSMVIVLAQGTPAPGEEPARTPFGFGPLGVSIHAFLEDAPSPDARKEKGAPDVDDPGPEAPPYFPQGFRPEPWETWEIPEPLRRVSFWIFAGSSGFVRKSEVLEMDNPSLFMTGSEIVEWDALWQNGTFGATLCAGVAVFPALRAVLEVDFFLFNREPSPPAIHVVYVDNQNHQRLLSADAFRGARACLCAQFEFPVDDVFKEPRNLFRWRRPKGSSGFVPILFFGAGLAYFEKPMVKVFVTEAGAGRTVTKKLFERTWSPAAQIGTGILYRFSFLGIGARALIAYNGTPWSGWKPFTDSAEALITYSLQLGVGAYF
ncbi:MAG: hypothetical protein ACYS47_17430 [Planctomycetota bacterium]|jgi:hypothetical protein